MNLYFFIGTKAQAIKCLPLINNALRRSENVIIVDSGQHVQIVNSILSEVNSNVEKLSLFKNSKNISNFKDLFFWFINFLYKHLMKRTIYQNGICIVHGDTLSTLLGLLWAKRNNLIVLHLESGLTSRNIFLPFPEEFIRRVVSRFSDVLICFDKNSFDYLIKRFKKSEKKIKQVSENTIIETLDEEVIKVKQRLITVTLHRTENLVNQKKLENFVDLLLQLSKKYTINWYLHEPTKFYLDKFKIKDLDRLNLSKLLDHKNFIKELKKSEIVITDGGSIQEECYLLGKKTLIWRNLTERGYALDNNMFISHYDIDNSLSFINSNVTSTYNKNLNLKPSEEILYYLEDNFG